MGRNPASNRRSKTLIWCGVNSGMECSQMWSSGTANRSCAAAQSTHWLRQLKTKQRAVVMQQLLSRGRIRFRRRALQLRENLTQRPNQLVRFFKRRQILALNILDQSDLERLRIVRSLLDARDFAQSRRARRVIAPLP